MPILPQKATQTIAIGVSMPKVQEPWQGEPPKQPAQKSEGDQPEIFSGKVEPDSTKTLEQPQCEAIEPLGL